MGLGFRGLGVRGLGFRGMMCFFVSNGEPNEIMNLKLGFGVCRGVCRGTRDIFLIVFDTKPLRCGGTLATARGTSVSWRQGFLRRTAGRCSLSFECVFCCVAQLKQVDTLSTDCEGPFETNCITYSPEGDLNSLLAGVTW